MQDAKRVWASAGSKDAVAANRFGLDYRREAAAMGPPPTPIIDFHTHVNGEGAAQIWRQVADLFGVSKALTMVRLEEAPTVRRVMGDRVEFIAFTNFRAADRAHAFRQGYLDDIQRFHDEFGSKMIKLWNAPRMREYFPDETGKDLTELDGEWRVKHVELARKLGMAVMVHIADPDTWFATKYSDAAKYGLKRDHYRGFEVMLDRYSDMPWFAAHMGGYAEDLDLLDGLLERHPNLSIDTSATKWIVRELSRYSRERVLRFLTRWRGRVIFGSDIVTTDEHLVHKQGPVAHPMAELADSPESAFDLYSSRYFTLRTMFETEYDGESPIADPDLNMVDPAKHTLMAAPRLRGFSLPRETLVDLYRRSAEQVFAKLGIPVGGAR